MRKARVSLGILLAWTFAASPVRLAAQQPPTFGSALAGLRFRTIGPANMSGRIVLRPTNQDIVYVAALGHLWGPNKERGLFDVAQSTAKPTADQQAQLQFLKIESSLFANG